MFGCCKFYYLVIFYFIFVQILHMDEEPADGSEPTHMQRQGELSESVKSLEADESSRKDSSVHNKRSLVQVMSLEGSSGQDDIYEYYLMDKTVKRRLRNSQSSQKSSLNENSMQCEQQVYKRRSSVSRTAGHECGCDDNNCLGYHCSCYDQPNEICTLGNCCQSCIRLKNLALQSQGPDNAKSGIKKCTCPDGPDKSGRKLCTCLFSQHSSNFLQDKSKKLSKNGVKSQKSQGGGCSCKKSHCLKKYCACFASGSCCSQNCQCQQCENTNSEHQAPPEPPMGPLIRQQQNEESDVDIDKYIEDNEYENNSVPSNMHFEMLDFHNAYRG